MTLEQRLAVAEGLTEVLARTTGSAEHPSGMARATATATGELRALDLHPAALARGSDAVGRLVVETARLATDAAVQRSYDELAKSLGDGMAMAVEAFAGPPPVRSRPAGDPAAVPAGDPAVDPEPARRQFQPPGRPARQAPWQGQQARPPHRRPAPAPVEDDDDDYFADPFRGQRQ